jgi:hypothetical protein
VERDYLDNWSGQFADAVNIGRYADFSIPGQSIIAYSEPTVPFHFPHNDWYNKAENHLLYWKQKFSLNVLYSLHVRLPENILGKYIATSKSYKIKGDKFGEILIDVEKHSTLEELLDTVRHEIAHAVTDLRWDCNGHGEKWKRIAKLMSVDVSRY